MSSQNLLPTPRGGSASTPTSRTAPTRLTAGPVVVLVALVAAAIGVIVGVEGSFPGVEDMSGPRIVQGVAGVVAFLAYVKIVALVKRDADRADAEEAAA